MLARFKGEARRVLTPEELARDTARGIIVALAGFNFTALMALAVIDAAKYGIAIYYLLASFVAFYISLNAQSYKNRRWEDQLSAGLKDAASGWLLFSVVAIMNVTSPNSHGARYIVAASMAFAWGLDVWIRLALTLTYYRDLAQHNV
jgi:hypothetical protein